MITFELVTLAGVKFGNEVWEVMLPTPDGIVAIFPHHMPLVTLAVPGVISIRRNQNDSDDKLEHYATNGGVIEINGKRVRILVDEADAPDEISEKQVEEALARAQEMAKNSRDQVDLDNAHQLIQRYRSQLKVAGLRRHKRR